MGDKTALEIITDICDELKLARPSSVTATDPQTRQLLRFLNKTGVELVKRRDWDELEAEHILEFGAPVELSATTTEGDATVIVSDTSALSALGAGYWSVTGNGVQIGCRIASITDGTTLELTETVDETQAGATFTFTRDTFDYPSDWKRDIPQTHWDRRFQWRLIGPDSPQMDQWHRSGIVTIGPRRRFRRTGAGTGVAKFRIYPPPSASSDFPGTLVWEYMSKSWVIDANGVRSQAFSVDTDEHVFPDDDLLVMGVRWRYWHINGLPYKEMQKEYYENLSIVHGSAEGGPVLSTNNRRPGYLITPANVQDGNFPSE
jgi:hypothetical protein